MSLANMDHDLTKQVHHPLSDRTKWAINCLHDWEIMEGKKQNTQQQAIDNGKRVTDRKGEESEQESSADASTGLRRP